MEDLQNLIQRLNNKFKEYINLRLTKLVIIIRAENANTILKINNVEIEKVEAYNNSERG